MQSHLLIADGMNLFRRLYEGDPGPDNQAKVDRSLKSSRWYFKNAYELHNPTHMAIALDAPGKNWRHDIYPDYKLGRTPMPDALRQGIDEFTMHLDGHGWGRFINPGEEADDTIASLAKRAIADGMDVTVLSTDKDLVFLLTLGARIYDQFSNTWRDEAWCQAKFGVRSDQLLDFLALTGDASDGIPGVSKVGAKTAAKLLLEHDTLEGVLAADVPGVVGRNLKEQADLARLSRQLTAMHMDLFTSNLNTDLIGRPPRPAVQS